MRQFEPDLLDRAILAALPDVGEKFGKYLAATMSSSQVKAKVDPSYSAGSYGSRLRILSENGYAVKVIVRGGKGAGWQRTPKGRLAAEPESEAANG